MKPTPRLAACLAATGFGLLCSAAVAHGGADAGLHHRMAADAFVAGLTHPFTGGDHLAAMLAVGFWSADRMRRPWLAPLAFAALLLAGAAYTLLQARSMPAVEPMIAASLLVLGLLVATRAALPGAAAAAVAGGFALFHGAAHGTELAGPGAWSALGGMLLATLLLHLAGMALGRWARHGAAWAAPLAGAAVAAFGTALLLPMALS